VVTLVTLGNLVAEVTGFSADQEVRRMAHALLGSRRREMRLSQIEREQRSPKPPAS
jgi:hypothetical protein